MAAAVRSILYLSFLAVILLSGCGGRPELPPLSSKPAGQPVQIQVPLGLPPVPIPDAHPPTAKTIALGKKLFFSPVLSVDGSISCASCHQPDRGFTDGKAVSAGVGGKNGPRNAPSVQNAAYQALQFWDGRAPSLETQALGPMMNSLEMAHSSAGIEQRCSESPELRKDFEEAFGPAPPGRSPVTMDRVTVALASYERTLLKANSPFDRFEYGGDKTALTDSARRGLEIFRSASKGNCTACHTIGNDFALFSDGKFHNLGVGMNPEGELTDLGRYEVTKRERDRGAFRTPSLRNVAQTAPYMHDGSLKTLKQVVDFYVGGGNSNPWRDPLIHPLTQLTGQERADLVSFLESLTGEDRP